MGNSHSYVLYLEFEVSAFDTQVLILINSLDEAEKKVHQTVLKTMQYTGQEER